MTTLTDEQKAAFREYFSRIRLNTIDDAKAMYIAGIAQGRKEQRAADVRLVCEYASRLSIAEHAIAIAEAADHLEESPL
jgi:hypothetical protein